MACRRGKAIAVARADHDRFAPAASNSGGKIAQAGLNLTHDFTRPPYDHEGCSHYWSCGGRRGGGFGALGKGSAGVWVFAAPNCRGVLMRAGPAGAAAGPAGVAAWG